MCIRDRRKSLDGAVKALRRFVYDAEIARESDLASLDAATSVSYTHLRAHETVLDLVCRLLLEKKNTPSSKNTHIIYVHIKKQHR